MTTNVTKPRLSTLPSTHAELMGRRQLTSERTFNDSIEEAFKALWDDPERGGNFRKHLDALYADEAVTGDLFMDDIKAAEMLQSFAEIRKQVEISNAKLKKVHRAMSVVLRRFGLTRKQRREHLTDDD